MKKKFDRSRLAPILGHWQSDRKRTLEYWVLPKSVPKEVRALLRSKDMFGKRRLDITADTFTETFNSESNPGAFRIVFHAPRRAILAFGRNPRADFCDLHFDGPNSFYMIAGRGNCEFFKRVKANKPLKKRRAHKNARAS
jgi:hypothetical protein